MSSSYHEPDSRLDYGYSSIDFDPDERMRPRAASGFRGRHAALLAGTVATMTLLLLASRAPVPIAAPEPPVPTISVSLAPVAEIAPASVIAVATPAAAPKPVPVVHAATTLQHVAAPPRRPAMPPVTVSTRNVQFLSTRNAPPVLAGPSPLPRPSARVAETARIALPAVGAERPLRRPGSGATVRAVAKPTGPSDDGRPQPRPVQAVAVQTTAVQPAPAIVVASLSPAPAEMALAAMVAGPRARPDTPAAAVKPAAAAVPRVAKPAKAAAKPAAKPSPAVQVVRAPAPVRKAAPVPAKVATQAPLRVVPTRTAAVPVAKVATQAPVRVVPVPTAKQPARTLAPAPARVAALTPAKPKAAAPTTTRSATAAKPAQPQRTAARKPATERAGLSRGNVSLLGVFSGEDGRHALLLLPDGSIERVRAGDRIRGAQVAAIDGDSVRLSGGGRDTLLRLPD